MTADSAARILLEERLALTGFVRSIVRDAHVAEDIFQESCVKAIARSASLTTREDLLAWTRTVARNLAIDHIRKRQRHVQVLSNETLDLLAQEAPSPSERASTVDRLRALEACLKTLTPKAQEVLALRYGESLPGNVVAARLHRKPQTIYKTLARAYAQLRLCMKRALQSDL